MPSGERVEVPDVSYARSGDVSIAYQVVGEGPTDLVLFPFLSNLYTLWQAPKFAEFGYRLAEGRRLIVVNARGVGLSDRPRGFTIESRMDDLRAVMDTVGSERPALLGIAEAAATCAVFAASNPDRVERLILYDPWSQSMLDEREREEALAGLPAQRDRWGRRDVLEQFAAELNPQWASDPDYLDWFVWHHRLHFEPFLVGRLQADADRSRRRRCPPGDPGADARDVQGAGTPPIQNRLQAVSQVPSSSSSRGSAERSRRIEFAVEAVETFLEGEPCAPHPGHRAGDRPLHRSREFDPACRGARRPRLAQPARAASRARADGACALQRYRDRHCRRRVLRKLRRPGACDLVRPRDRRARPGARARGARRHPHRRVRASGGQARRPGRERGRPGVRSRRGRERSSSPRRSRTSSRAPRSSSRTAARTS